jgi:hypothetical protein
MRKCSHWDIGQKSGFTDCRRVISAVVDGMPMEPETSSIR